jgi:hypothetical protein
MSTATSKDELTPESKNEGEEGWDVDFRDKSGEIPWGELDGAGKAKRLCIILFKISLIVGALYLFIWCAARAR